MVDISSLSSSFVGFAVPYIVAAVKRHLLPWSGKAAIWLSLVISTLCVSAAAIVGHFQFGFSLDLGTLITDGGIAFSLSQVVYEHVQDSLK